MILSKLTVALVMWTAAYVICTGISWAYTAYFWKGEILHDLFSAAVLVWIYGILLLAVGLFGSVLCKNAYGNLLITGGLCRSAVFIEHHTRCYQIQSAGPCVKKYGIDRRQLEV